MQKKLSLIATLLAFFSFAANAQDGTTESVEWNYRNWMSTLSDKIKIAEITFPGSHDSATASCDFELFGVGPQTQALSIGEQFDGGVRQFDLRPCAHKADELMIYHGSFTTNVTFNSALNTLRDKLIENPSECAVIIMRNENDKQADGADWKALMSEALRREDIASYLVDFKYNMTLGDMRGKILVISRDSYNGQTVGAMVGGTWEDNKSTYMAGTTLVGRRSSAKVYWQDYYDHAGTEAKMAAIMGLAEVARTLAHDGRTWLVNNTAGYQGMGVSTNYANNAREVNWLTADALQAMPTDETFPLGMIQMDFAAVDSYKGTPTYGTDLIRAIIAHNIKYATSQALLSSVGQPVSEERPTDAYTVGGMKVSAVASGVVVSEGKKYLKK